MPHHKLLSRHWIVPVLHSHCDCSLFVVPFILQPSGVCSLFAVTYYLYLAAIWRVIRTLLNEAQQKAVIFVKGEEILNYIDRDQLLTIMGGTVGVPLSLGGRGMNQCFSCKGEMVGVFLLPSPFLPLYHNSSFLHP